MDFDRLCETMRRLALEAGDAIMEIYEAPDMGVEAKADASPVTEADLRADRIISRRPARGLPGRAPRDRGAGRDPRRAGRRDFLIVDPLDGTKEFVQRRGDFTVNIAYVEDGVPVRGVVYAPAKGRLFYTNAVGRRVEEERGPTDADPRRASVPIRVAPARQPRPAGRRLQEPPRRGHRRLHRPLRGRATSRAPDRP